MLNFSGARDFVVNSPQVVNQQASDTSKGTGLQKLLEASIPGASHDSSDRYPPPICHPGTRKDYIEYLTQWGLNLNKHTDRIAWLKGPAGVGKSAVAQSCAEALGDKLGAAFFFSRPNHREDPNRFFTSIAYQLAVRCDSYSDILDRRIIRDPTLLKKSLPRQFQALLVSPFRQPAIWEEIGELVIIVDGLDECLGAQAQIDIVEIVAESLRKGTSPFLWMFLSRLEPGLVTTFNLPHIKPICLEIDLPVSRTIDTEILLYLTDKFGEIGRRHGLVFWPSEEEIWALVDFSAGLFACAHAIVHFVGEDDPAGPVDQLQTVLRLAKHSGTKGTNHPLLGLNVLYTLIMERVSPKMLQTVLWILLATRMPNIYSASDVANLLGLSELQFRNACQCLHSVMSIEAQYNPRISFYHASFMDFLEDPARSKEFCVWSDPAKTLLDKVLKQLDSIQVGIDPQSGGFVTLYKLAWPQKGRDPQRIYYSQLISAFFKLLFSIGLGDDPQRIRDLADFDYKKVCFGRDVQLQQLSVAEMLSLGQKVRLQPELLRPRVFKNFLTSLFFVPGHSFHYTIGNGKKKAVLKIGADSVLSLHPRYVWLVGKLMKELSRKPTRPEEVQ